MLIEEVKYLTAAQGTNDHLVIETAGIEVSVSSPSDKIVEGSSCEES